MLILANLNCHFLRLIQNVNGLIVSILNCQRFTYHDTFPIFYGEMHPRHPKRRHTALDDELAWHNGRMKRVLVANYAQVTLNSPRENCIILSPLLQMSAESLQLVAPPCKALTATDIS